MFLISWYTEDSETCYTSRLSKNIISAIVTGYAMMLRHEKFIKFVIFDEFRNVVFRASRDSSTYSTEIIKNLM